MSDGQPGGAADSLSSWCLRISCVLWVIWGVVHVLAGIMTMLNEPAVAMSSIADAVDPESLQLDYPGAVDAVLNQHGFNLFWIGAVTTLAAPFVWRKSITAIWGAALIAGLTDLGYFLFMDLGGFVHFVPGTLMTLICSAAILLSGVAVVRMPRGK